MSRARSGRNGGLLGTQGTQQVQPAEVGHGGSEQGLQEGLAPSPVAGLAHAEVLEVVDLSLDHGAAAKLMNPLFMFSVSVCASVAQATQ